MNDREGKVRAALITYFPMFIATLSLLTSIYNGYLNGKFVDLIQSNVGRTEYMRTCKEIIDAYFQVKLRTGLASTAGSTAERSGASLAQAEAANAAAKFAALGTWLANLRNETVRARYSELSAQLDRIAKEAPRISPGDLARSFEPADRIFSELNDDCVKSAKSAPL